MSNVSLSWTPVGTFASKDVANGVSVAVSGLALSGSAASNYSLTQPTLSADIMPKALTVSGLAGTSGSYSGVTVAAITGTGSLVGVVLADVSNVSLSGTPVGTFASREVARGSAVAVAGLSLSGSAASNYSLTQPTLSADVTPNARTGSGLAATSRACNG